MEPRLILVTVPNLATAKTIAQALLEEKLLACVNIIPTLTSLYWWQNKIEEAQECLLLCKSTTAQLPALQKRLQELHPYETPEFLALAIDEISPKYLAWLEESVRS